MLDLQNIYYFIKAIYLSNFAYGKYYKLYILNKQLGLQIIYIILQIIWNIKEKQ